MKARFQTMAFWMLAVTLAIGLSRPMQARAGKTPYPQMAPLDQYLMDRDAEIVLARSAAPEAISRDATVMVLGRNGYEVATKGTNGFVCAVERSWLNPFSHPQFWNPKERGPICYNPPAARSVLPITYLRTKLALAGLSQAQMIERIKTAYAKKELPALEPGAMSYMMAKQAYLNDEPVTEDGSHNVAHLMFYTPLMDGAEWGANVPNSPIFYDPTYKGDPEHIDIFVVPVGMWSDGSAAPLK